MSFYRVFQRNPCCVLVLRHLSACDPSYCLFGLTPTFIVLFSFHDSKTDAWEGVWEQEKRPRSMAVTPTATFPSSLLSFSFPSSSSYSPKSLASPHLTLTLTIVCIKVFFLTPRSLLKHHPDHFTQIHFSEPEFHPYLYKLLNRHFTRFINKINFSELTLNTHLKQAS